MSSASKSPWLLHYNASSCNGCDIEILAALTPVYDVERFGIINTGNPAHADIFVVTGGVNEQNKVVLKNLYDQIPEPKVVVAVGICASSGGVFRDFTIFPVALTRSSLWMYMSRDVPSVRRHSSKVSSRLLVFWKKNVQLWRAKNEYENRSH